jgi:hypothetical protein
MASPLTVYPHASDGHVRAAATTWAACRGAATGDQVENSATNDDNVAYSYKANDSSWLIRRAFFCFDVETAGLPGDCTITGVTFSLAGRAIKAEATTVVESTQADPTALATADFDACGTTELVTHLASWVKYDTALNVFTFNAAGLTYANANKTWMKLCLREYTYDFLNSAPGNTTLHSVGCYYSENGGVTYDPKLVITYTEAASSAYLPQIMCCHTIPPFVGGY